MTWYLIDIIMNLWRLPGSRPIPLCPAGYVILPLLGSLAFLTLVALLAWRRVRSKTHGAVHDGSDADHAPDAWRHDEPPLCMALAAAQMGSWRWDARTRLATRDAELNRIFGLKPVPSTTPLEDFVERVHPDDRADVLRAFERAVEQGDVYLREFRIIQPDGSIRWLRDQGRPFFDEVGQLLHVTGAAVDITERKWAEQALIDSEKRYRTLFDNAGDAIFLMRGDVFVECNQTTLDLFRATKDQIVGHTPFELSPATQPDGRDSAVKGHEILAAAMDGAPQAMQWRHQRPDGSEFDTEVRLTRVVLSDGVYVQAIVRDITERKQAETEILREKAFSESLIDSLPGIFYLFDDSGRMLRWNRRLADVTGYTARELASMRPEDFFEGEERDYIAAQVRLACEQGEATATARLVAKDGRRTPYYLTGIRLVVEGRPLLIGVGMDITERQRAEQALAASEHRFRTLVSNIPGMVYRSSTLHPWPMDYVSDNALGLTGYTAADLLTDGRQMFGHLILEEDVDHVTRTVEEAIAAGRPFFIEYRIRSADGRIRWVHDRGQVYFDEQGQPLWLDGLVLDVTERKQAEVELIAHREHLEELVGSRTLELSEKNRQLQTALNELKATQEQLIQSERMAVLGRLASGIAHEVNNPLGAIASTSATMRHSVERFIDEGPRFAALLEGDTARLVSDAFAAAAAPTLSTLSSRERRELRDAVASKLQINGTDPRMAAELLVDLSIHDDYQRYLPLLSQPDGVRLLERVRDLARICRGTRVIEVATNRAAKIIFALNNYARDNETAVLERVDLRESLDSVLRLYHARYKERVDVLRQYDDVPPVECYTEQIAQVWTNLILNALQAMDYRGQLTISLHRENSDAVVAVADTGHGVAPEIRDRIFDTFFTTKRQGEGVGLGLDIVKTIVQRHHGRIDVDSTPGHGATFTVRVPIDQPRGA